MHNINKDLSFSQYKINIKHVDFSVSTLLHRLVLSLIIVCIVTPALANINTISAGKKQTSNKVAISIHGGAGTILKKNMTPETEAAYMAILEKAIKAGHQKLLDGKDGSEAIVSAIQIMEDSPLFNAGKGAVFTFDVTHELDASIMHGASKQAGAVSGIKTVKNPILAALLVMNESEHVMLSGAGAEQFAALKGLEQVPNDYFSTERRLKALQKAKRLIELQTIKTKPTIDLDMLKFQDFKYGTVGAVALDKFGNIVAGTSTGGMTAKRYGRVGDSPIIGAGTYADNDSCAVSATGHGEYFIRHNVAADICARVKYQNISVNEAAKTVIFDVLNKDAGSGGVIVIDKHGNIAMVFNTPGMYRASIDVDNTMSIGIYQD